MKSLIALTALVCLGLSRIVTQQNHVPAAADMQVHAPGAGAAPRSTFVNITDPHCGLGFTYCGYILKAEKNFNDDAIKAAYCASGGNCGVNGDTTATNYLQALFVCLPGNAVPRARARSRTRTTTGNAIRDSNKNNKARRRGHGHRRDDGPPDGESLSPPPGEPTDVKIELICACSGGNPFEPEENVCLNPDGDHVGRCSSPCYN